MRRRSGQHAVVAFFVLACGASADERPVLDNYKDARQLLWTAAGAAGSLARLRSLQNVSFRLAGETHNPLQGVSASRLAAPEADGDVEITTTLDLGRNRYVSETRQRLRGGFELHTAVMFRDGALYSLSPSEGRFTVQRTGASAASILDSAARFLPPLLIRRAADNLSSARLAGGQPGARVVEFSWDEKARIRLVLDQETGRVVETRLLGPDPLKGDDETIYRYSGSQTFAGLSVPERVEVVRRGQRVWGASLDSVRVDAPLEDALFSPPASLKDGGETPSPRTTPIGEGAYDVEGLGGGYYRSAFFVLSEFVVVFDAPLGLPAATRVLQEIRKVAGEKPVRYVVLSHFHNDHAAGVGAYVQAGASVVTTVVNREIVLRYAQARSALGGLEPPATPAPEPRIELVNRRLELRDAGGRNLLVFEVGPTPHVDSMLVLYDPKTRLLVNGDLYSNLTPFNSTFASFVDWVQDHRLDVARVAGVHHPPIEFKELEALQTAWKATAAAAKGRR